MAVFFTVLLGMAALALGYVLYHFSQQNFVRETQAAIDSEMRHVLSLVEAQPMAMRIQIIQQKSQEKTNTVYLYRGEKDVFLAGNIKNMPAQVERIKEGVIRFDIPATTSQTIAAKIHTFSDGTRLLIGRDIHALLQSYEQFKWLSGLILGFLLIVILVSFYISAFVVTRINRIALLAQEMMVSGDLSTRIHVDSHWDDLSRLAMVLNSLLDKIEQLMLGMKGVGDNIAHDLRTPLTRLRNHMEALKSDQTNISEDCIDALIEEADKLLVTFNALLRISSLENGQRTQPFESIDMRMVLQDVVELYEPLAEEKNITFITEYRDAPHCMADKNIMFQSLANLLDNAIKFSPVDAEVSIALYSDMDKAHIVISDKGVGVTTEDFERVFERFYRTESSRHTAGNGLGLSLVKAAIDAHQGKIWLTDNTPGLAVHILL